MVIVAGEPSLRRLFPSRRWNSASVMGMSYLGGGRRGGAHGGGGIGTRRMMCRRYTCDTQLAVSVAQRALPRNNFPSLPTHRLAKSVLCRHYDLQLGLSAGVLCVQHDGRRRLAARHVHAGDGDARARRQRHRNQPYLTVVVLDVHHPQVLPRQLVGELPPLLAMRLVAAAVRHPGGGHLLAVREQVHGAPGARVPLARRVVLQARVVRVHVREPDPCVV